MGYIAPRARARQTVLKTETGTHGVLGIVVSATVGTNAPRLEDHAEHILQEVKLVRSHIVEIATSGNLRLESPRQGLMIPDGIGIGGAQGFGIAYLHIQDLPYPTALHDLLHLLEIRQVTAVVGHEAGNTRLF